jgi:hypothetical protein
VYLKRKRPLPSTALWPKTKCNTVHISNTQTRGM